VNNRDAARLALLIERGYRPNGEWLYLEPPLGDPLPEARIPAGFLVRAARRMCYPVCRLSIGLFAQQITCCV
jgi:hypothetical protein